MGTWIDFRQLREQLDFGAVLAHYQVAIKNKGSQGTAFCPLPDHPKEPKPSRSFSVNFQKKVFQCFSCRASGNILDLIAIMEGLNPKDSQQFRRAAVIAQERFVGSAAERARPKDTPARDSNEPADDPHRQVPSEQRVLVNEPLDFALKNLDTRSSYLFQRGLTEETIDHFGLGYCTKGTFAGRIVIPLHDIKGRLIGYAGRLVFDEAIDAANPKYLYPPRREREGRILEFSRSLFLYHGHALTEPRVHDLIVVQGFPAAWWLWQKGYKDVVALMGASCSVDQANAIVALTTGSARIWCFTDADKAGDKCAQSLFGEVGPHRFCKWVRPKRGQLTDCDGDELSELLAWKIEC